MTDIKKSYKVTIAGLHKLPDGSLRFGKKHKRHRSDKMPVFVMTEITDVESKIEVAI